VLSPLEPQRRRPFRSDEPRDPTENSRLCRRLTHPLLGVAFVDQAIGEWHCTIIDQVIDETLNTAPQKTDRPPTRAQQRVATRLAILDATAECLIDDGYAALTTRRIAERAGIAQNTLMHHFETRELLLIEAVTHVAYRLADQALSEIDLAALSSPEHRDAVIEQAWREFTSPQALAAAQLWIAAWAEPELAIALNDLEHRINSILMATAATLFPDQAENPEFAAVIDAAVSLIRGLVMAIPVSGRAAVDTRWKAIKPLISRAAAEILDPGT
jgi:AcrR family transcriptional regulator